MREEQRRRWRAGQGVPAEVYLERHPNLDAESVVDLIFQEFLLRESLGEKPQLAEYQRRFPEHAAVLQAQLELERAMASSVGQDSNPARPPAGSESGPTAVQPARADDELRALLRVRLRNLCLIGSAFLLTQLVTLLGGETLGPGSSQFAAAVHVVPLPFLAGSVILLWRRPDLTLRTMRWLELSTFAIVAGCLGVLTWAFFDEGMLSKYAAVGPEAVMILAFYVSMRWFALLVIYGLFIPNTWRRCALVVSCLGVTPVVLCSVLVWSEAALAVPTRLGFVFELACWMVFGAVLAVYGCHKMQVLRQQALADRRLGQYQLKRRLGAGGMGEVYLAEHVLLRRPCAVKLVRPDRAGDPKELRRFEREVQATALLTHPNTVQVYDYGHAADGTFYYAMEYLPGLNLDELVARDGPLPPERAVHLLRQICGALAEAHAVGLIHRDIKPGNIIVGQDGGRRDVAKLLDFGLARSLAKGADETRLTQVGDLAGTPAFMSPEQAAGQHDVDARSDVYSLGALAYFLLTGQPPFAGRSAVRVLAAHLYEAPPPLTDRTPALPAELQHLVLRCLAKNPGERFPDVVSVDTALAACPFR